MRKFLAIAVALFFVLNSPKPSIADEKKGTEAKAVKPLVALHGEKSKVVKGSFRRIESSEK